MLGKVLLSVIFASVSAETLLNWNSVASDSSGKYLAAGTDSGFWRSQDYGQTWKNDSSGITGKIQTIAANSGGDRLYACTSTGSFRSTNYGYSWLKIPYFTSSCGNIATDSTGQSVVTSSTFSISKDYGETWSEITGIVKSAPRDVGIGGQVISLAGNGYVYVSTDGGATWKQRLNESDVDFTATAVSGNGQVIYAFGSFVGSSNLYVSKNAGSSWDCYSSAADTAWKQIVTTSSGQYMVGASDKLYYATNFGANYVKSNMPGFTLSSYRPLAMDMMGGQVVSVYSSPDYPYPFLSHDKGATWSAPMAPTGSTSWTGVCHSGSGTMISAMAGQNLVSGNGNAWSSVKSPVHPEGLTWLYHVFDDSCAHQIIADTRHTLMISNDYGTTYATPTGGGLPEDVEINTVAISRCGQFVGIGSVRSGVYLSSDFGNTFIKTSLADSWGWSAVGIAKKGKFVIAASDSVGYFSTDGGVTWAESAGVKGARGFAVDTEAAHIFAYSAGSVLLSENGGSVFVNVAVSAYPQSYTGITCDTTCQYLSAISTEWIFNSVNFGKTWGGVTNKEMWKFVDSDATGQFRVVSAVYGGVYMSQNYGSSFERA